MIIDATFWVAISFLIFVGVLGYFKIPQKIDLLLTEKIKETKNELDEAERLKDEAKTLLSDYENKLNQANDEAINIIKQAKKESEKKVIESTEKFYQLIDNKKKLLNQKINQMKEDAIKEVKNTSIKISIKTVEEIIKNSIDKKKLDRLYDESLSQSKIALKKTVNLSRQFSKSFRKI